MGMALRGLVQCQLERGSRAESEGRGYTKASIMAGLSPTQYVTVAQYDM